MTRCKTLPSSQGRGVLGIAGSSLRQRPWLQTRGEDTLPALITSLARGKCSEIESLRKNRRLPRENEGVQSTGPQAL